MIFPQKYRMILTVSMIIATVITDISSVIIDIITCYDYDFVTTFNIITISCCYHYLVSTGLKMLEVNRFRAEAPVWISQDRRKEAFLSGDAQRSLEVYGSIRGSLQGSIRGPITVLYGDLYLGLGLRFYGFAVVLKAPKREALNICCNASQLETPASSFNRLQAKQQRQRPRQTHECSQANPEKL